MNRWVEEGIEYLRKGDRTQAERALRIAVQEAPRDVESWLWLSKAVESDAEQVTILLKVLDLDPHNRPARQTLDILQQRQGSPGLPHVSPFSFQEEAMPGKSEIEGRPPIASSEEMNDTPPGAEEARNRLGTWIAVAILILAVALILLAVVLPRL